METRKALEEHYTVEDYYNTPKDVRTELIDGEFYDMAAPDTAHQRLSFWLSFKIQEYINAKGGSCEVFPAPFGVQLSEDEDTVLEPDISVICDSKKLTKRGCVGAPDWIIEVVSPGNSGHDYITKLGKYMRAGVREYWIVDPEKNMITVYAGELMNIWPVHHTFEDKVRAVVFADLMIDFKEIADKL